MTDQQVIKNAQASYMNILLGWGIQPSPEVQNFVKQAVAHELSSAAFLSLARNTKFYAQRFPGILKKDGTLLMTESQYISGYLSAKDYAASLGRNLSQQAYGLAIKNGNSPSEIKAKLSAVDKLKAYGPQLQEFNDYLLSTGKINKPLEKQDLMSFFLGQRKDLEQEWTVAHTAMQMQELAGVNVGKPKAGGDVSYKELTGMVRRFTALGGDIEQVDFAKMGALINEVIPKNELYGAGITKRDIVNMMLSGKNAPEITTRVQRVLDTYEAAVNEAPQHGDVNMGTPQSGSE